MHARTHRDLPGRRRVIHRLPQCPAAQPEAVQQVPVIKVAILVIEESGNNVAKDVRPEVRAQSSSLGCGGDGGVA